MSWFTEYVPTGLFVVLLVAAGVADVLWRKIPNWVVIGLVALYVAMAFAGLTRTDMWSAVDAAALSLVATYGLYHFGILGAGDAKLFSAASLFTGLTFLLHFAVVTAILGGLLAIGYLIVHPSRSGRGLSAPDGADGGSRGVPYGVPIAAAAVIVGVYSGLLGSA